MIIVETLTEGDLGSVKAAAAWLRGDWARAVTASGDHANAARQLVGSDWTGEAAAGYAEVARLVVTDTDTEAWRAEEAAELLDVLAARMEHRETRMAGIREVAERGDLEVNGTRISLGETSLTVGEPDPADQARKRAKQDLLEDLLRLTDEANDEFLRFVEGELSDAVAHQRARAHRGPTIAEVGLTLASNAGANLAGTVAKPVDLVVNVGQAVLEMGEGKAGEVEADDVKVGASGVLGSVVTAVNGANPGSVVVSTLGQTAIGLAGGPDLPEEDPLTPDDTRRRPEPVDPYDSKEGRAGK